MSQLLLAVDTSGKNGSLALARLTPGESEIEISVLEVVPLAGGAFSAQLVPQIAALLESTDIVRAIWEPLRSRPVRGRLRGCGWAWLPLRLWPRRCKSRSWQFHCWRRLRGAAQRVAGFSRRWMRAGVTCMPATTNSGLSAHCRMHSERLLSREEFLAEATGKAVVTPDAGLAETVRAAGTAAGIPLN